MHVADRLCEANWKNTMVLDGDVVEEIEHESTRVISPLTPIHPQFDVLK
jgi:hypothetical protein